MENKRRNSYTEIRAYPRKRFNAVRLILFFIILLTQPSLLLSEGAVDRGEMRVTIDRVEPYTWQKDGSEGWRIFARLTAAQFPKGRIPNTCNLCAFVAVPGWMPVQIQIGNSWLQQWLDLQTSEEASELPDISNMVHSTETNPPVEVPIAIWMHEIPHMRKYLNVGDPKIFTQHRYYIDHQILLILYYRYFDDDEQLIHEFYDECDAKDLICSFSYVDMGNGHDVQIWKEEDTPERRGMIEALAKKYGLKINISTRSFKGE